MVNQIITDNGKNLIFDRVFRENPTQSTIKKYKIGAGTRDPTPTDADLQNPIEISSGVELANLDPSLIEFLPNENKVLISTFLTTSQYNGFSLSEIGLFNDDATPKMFNRVTHSPIQKTADNEIVYEQEFGIE